MHPGEVFAAVGGLLICVPYIQHLISTPKAPIPASVWQFWATGFLLIYSYYEFHIAGGHKRHHHVITDIVHTPATLRLVFPAAAALAMACLVRDKTLSGELSPNSPPKERAMKIAQWVLPPVVIGALMSLVAYGLRFAFKSSGTYNFLLSLIGICGGVVYAAGGINALKNYHDSIDGAMLMAQMLGFLVLGLNTLLIYKVVDWKGLGIVACMFFMNLFLVVASILPGKWRGQGRQTYELVGKDDDDEEETRTSFDV